MSSLETIGCYDTGGCKALFREEENAKPYLEELQFSSFCLESGGNLSNFNLLTI